MDDLTAPFWAAAADHRLVRPVCRACGRSFFVPVFACPHCGSVAWGYEDSSGRGQVYSHTTVHRGPDGTWPVPYVLGIVDVEEGWSMLTRLLVEPPDEDEPGALIGTAVVVAFCPEGRPPFRQLPAFAPTGAR
ncbi:MAG TPA: OB-fold domain-containing protein [Acidimicrobiales bacterium]|nr:OB-fold domain-containing protein [Acidimicrobiales bacterium]